MITRGIVNEKNEATIPLRVIGPAGFLDVIAVLDTGFTSFLTLPLTVIEQLGLILTSRSTAIMADGSEQDFNVYFASVEWADAERTLVVYEVGDEILVGMGLLKLKQHRTPFFAERCVDKAVARKANPSNVLPFVIRPYL